MHRPQTMAPHSIVRRRPRVSTKRIATKPAIACKPRGSVRAMRNAAVWRSRIPDTHIFDSVGESEVARQERRHPDLFEECCGVVTDEVDAAGNEEGKGQ